MVFHTPLLCYPSLSRPFALRVGLSGHPVESLTPTPARRLLYDLRMFMFLIVFTGTVAVDR